MMKMANEQETREKILGTAFNLFISRGYAKTSMNDIIKESGISKGGLYHHFESKYDLARSCLFYWAEKEMGSLLVPDISNEKQPEDMIREFIDVGIEVMMTSQPIGGFFFELYQVAIEEEKDLEIWEGFMEDYAGYVEGIYQKMGADNPRMLSYILLSSMDGMALYYIILSKNEESFDKDALKKQYYRMFIDNVK